MWLSGIVVKALDLQLEIAGSIPAAALSSTQADHAYVPLSPSSIISYQRKMGSKQAHRATRWPRVHGLAASAGA